ncbi:hypothetical protein B6V75_02170 [Thioclava sp. F1Mire-8]|uniref:hypothetical protein n=1 Tax=Thioclava sp. F1Mire-8 TaxID=1973006 RepID=UPI000B53B2BF|nr:hypothetical protein [Thioclava sp. F1Mire-8]OWY04966.1 hypothetical protein B6V75_02170 [Thioclava sp. F1Mire-8]
MIQTLKRPNDAFTIEATIAKFGAGKVLRAALLALISRGNKPRPVDAGQLSDHLRRDIGLGPAEPPPEPWSLMR